MTPLISCGAFVIRGRARGSGAGDRRQWLDRVEIREGEQVAARHGAAAADGDVTVAVAGAAAPLRRLRVWGESFGEVAAEAAALPAGRK
eukprot:gene56172-52587_t